MKPVQLATLARRPNSWAILMTVLCAFGHGHAVAQESADSVYHGHLHMYEKAETYKSILGGKVHLLEPAGFDVVRDAPWALLVEGEISRETTRNVKTLLDRVPAIGIVYLNSPGGDLFAGLDLGRHLAAVGTQAVVGATEQCASACALAFLGARNRLILARPGSYGFHRQYYIRDGQIQYGSWSKDISVIETYLNQIGFSGVPADEIVGTTGLITYSDARLSDRGIVTMTRDAYHRLVKSIIEFSGVSITELYMASCVLHGHQFDCGGSLAATFRYPAVLDYLLEEPSRALDIKTLQKLRPLFRAVRRNQDLSSLNCRLMGGKEYVEYLYMRLAWIGKQQISKSVFDSFRDSVIKEMVFCKDLLESGATR